jgi:hypothetical protein
MSFLKNKKILLILLFLFSLAVNFLFLSWEFIDDQSDNPFMVKPPKSPALNYYQNNTNYSEQKKFSYVRCDSFSYLETAIEIKKFSPPNTLKRAPAYPLFLSFFLPNNIKLALFTQSILGAFVPVLLYLIILQFTKKKSVAFVFSIFFALDYQIITYYSVLLTEGLSIVLILVSLYLHIEHFKKLNSRKLLIVLLVFDALLIFLKPTFIILPALLYLSKIFLVIFNKNKRPIWPPIKILILGIVVSMFFVMSYMGLNYYRYKRFIFTDILDINIMGKILQYNYIDSYITKKDSPVIIKDIIKFYHAGIDEKLMPIKHPYVFTALLAKNIENYDSVGLKKINSYFLKGRYFEFGIRSIKALPQRLLEDRLFFSRPAINIEKSSFYIWVNRIFDYINKLKILGFLSAIILWIYFFRKKMEKECVALTIILVSTFSILLMISSFSYPHRATVRLRIPIETLLNLLVFLPFIVAINHLNIFKNKKIKNIRK